MFAFPQMVLVPALSSVGYEVVTWPNVGLLLAWLLVSALVGTSLGLLRDYTSHTAQSTTKEVPSVRVRPMKAVFPAGHDHREAA